jgi:hypothetical protein
MADMIDALEEAIRTHCADAMREHHKDDLAALDTQSLVQDYAAWRARFPSIRPRTIHESDVFAVSPLRDRHADGIAAIRRDIEAGADLTRYLSALVRFPNKRDLLLAHSGIHHLHMSDVMEQWRVKRTDHVLFVAFRPDAAYLIDIQGHEDNGANWSELAILETIVRNWPEAGILHGSQYATGLTQQYNDDARRELHRAGVSLFAEIGGRVWSSLGATINGAPLMAAQLAMKVWWDLHYRREAGEDELLATLGEVFPEDQIAADEWVAAVREDHYGFHAESAGVFVRLGALVLP